MEFANPASTQEKTKLKRNHKMRIKKTTEAETIIQKALNGESVDEIVDEITTSGNIAGMPLPMGIVKQQRDYQDDDDEKAKKRRRYYIVGKMEPDDPTPPTAMRSYEG